MPSSTPESTLGSALLFDRKAFDDVSKSFNKDTAQETLLRHPEALHNYAANQTWVSGINRTVNGVNDRGGYRGLCTYLGKDQIALEDALRNLQWFQAETQACLDRGVADTSIHQYVRRWCAFLHGFKPLLLALQPGDELRVLYNGFIDWIDGEGGLLEKKQLEDAAKGNLDLPHEALRNPADLIATIDGFTRGPPSVVMQDQRRLAVLLPLQRVWLNVDGVSVHVPYDNRDEEARLLSTVYGPDRNHLVVTEDNGARTAKVLVYRDKRSNQDKFTRPEGSPRVLSTTHRQMRSHSTSTV